MEGRLRSRRLHRVHGAARPRPHRPRRQDLPQGHARLHRRHRRVHRRPRFPERSRSPGQARGAPGMRIAAEALILFGRRHADKARELAAKEKNPARKKELLRIAEVCERVPAHAPRNFWEALQDYWFVHLGVIIEYNTWDSFNPGRLDQHLWPFYEKGLADGSLDRGIRPGAAGVLLGQVQQPARPAQGRRHGRGERDLHRFRPDQRRRPQDRRHRRRQPAVLPPPRRHRGDAHPPAQLDGPDLGQGPGRLPVAGPADRQDRLRPAFDLQHRHHRQGARAAGQIRRRTPATAGPAAASRPGPSARRTTP